jgi:hypothetical protein
MIRLSEQTVCLPAGFERRSPTLRNRVRRFFNDYWLVPVLICYLQLVTQLFYSADLPLARLYKVNRTFLHEIPIFYQIATREFPYTLVGHFSEFIDHWLYQWGLYQIPHEELKSALNSADTREEVYQLLVASRSHHQSEIGGIATLSYHPAGPRIHLYGIPSSNGDYSAQLHEAAESFLRLIDLLSRQENQEILEKVGVRQGTPEKIISLINNGLISTDDKKKIIRNFLGMYDALSYSRYLLSPFKLKEEIGKIPFGERFIGLYHFHNGINQPPSAGDIEESLRKRQLVMTFSEAGWRFYDVVKGDLRQIDIEVEKKGT